MDRTPSYLSGLPSYLLNFPFSLDASEANNSLMKDLDRSERLVRPTRAYRQWLTVYRTLTRGGVVYLLPSVAGLGDQPYVANLGLCPPHRPDLFLLSQFRSPPRRGEDRIGRRFAEALGYRVLQPPRTWEGEADLKFLRGNLYLGGYGIRTERTALDWLAEHAGLNIVPVLMEDRELYHFDCLCFPLSSRRVLLATAAIKASDLKRIEAVTDVIGVPQRFQDHGLTNLVRLGDTLLCSSHPDTNIGERWLQRIAERLGLGVRFYDLSEFAKSGADLSCMVLHMTYAGREHIGHARPLPSR